MTRRDNVRGLVLKFSGPTSTVYACPFCRHIEKFPHGGRHAEMWARENGRLRGRGYGLSMGSKLHAMMVAHIRAEHADKLEVTP